jgi:hypothetical protein
MIIKSKRCFVQQEVKGWAQQRCGGDCISAQAHKQTDQIRRDV